MALLSGIFRENPPERNFKPVGRISARISNTLTFAHRGIFGPRVYTVLPDRLHCQPRGNRAYVGTFIRAVRPPSVFDGSPVESNRPVHSRPRGLDHLRPRRHPGRSSPDRLPRGSRDGGRQRLWRPHGTGDLGLSVKDRMPGTGSLPGEDTHVRPSPILGSLFGRLVVVEHRQVQAGVEKFVRGEP